ncbi:diguanylate cyclase/phosphodiesterase (GGDEF & EAL domain) with PAS/PAC sensor(s) [Candidatus Burkholderia verschuerenii]|uniref:Diguanylate cyclase/phosphodiesterase (GGDEF & EAL domain) with PAS/PAC sensor(S) n=1 Tax=Candidatus Burkholderia verschuerenii TaxID=242163 RepID=A0A0L0MI31_9BURK|nr:diguanylate cyclase [Candidatus Burkholderia verschuerenii]KND61604.1 diguanylate cyclase/phosphodiesterase (GGDEF & EAL domain) with PAS/PAC sensor(s) [Candidatus Burkholderia verschuerenii]
MKNWQVAPFPANEDKRLRLLRSLELLDTPSEEVFDRVTRVAAEMLQAPIALVSLVDAQRQWFKSRVGVDVCETLRDASFCAHSVHSGRLLVVEDTHRDLRFADNPLVTGAPFIRFYAGVPLRSSEGLVLGTLCVIDSKPRTLSASAQSALCDLAATIERELIQREFARVSRVVQEVDRRKLLLSESRFHTIFHETPTGAAIVDLDGHFVEVNPKLCEITGYTADDLRRMTFQQITEEADLDADLQLVGDLLAGRCKTYSLEKRYRRRDGGLVWVDLSVALIRDDKGRPLHFVSVMQDISSRKQSEQVLRDYQQELERRVLERTSELTSSRAALQTITDNLPVLISHVDETLRYRFNNQTYREIFGVDPGALRGKSVRETLGEKSYSCCQPSLLRALAGERVTLEEVVYNAAPDRIWKATYVPELQRGEVVGLYIMSQDITDSKHRENAMRSEVMRDMLTGLPNRRALQEQLALAVDAAHTEDAPFALFFMDLDGFKNVNDDYGHDVGDDLLRQVAQRLKKITRADDLVCRLAGDEFVLLVRGVSSSSACSRIAQDICRSVGRAFELGATRAQIGASVGIATCPPGSRVCPDTILSDADRAMYEAKRKGRNGFRFATLSKGAPRPRSTTCPPTKAAKPIRPNASRLRSRARCTRSIPSSAALRPSDPSCRCRRAR